MSLTDIYIEVGLYFGSCIFCYCFGKAVGRSEVQ
jgi:hypothetical protein